MKKYIWLTKIRVTLIRIIGAVVRNICSVLININEQKQGKTIAKVIICVNIYETLVFFFSSKKRYY